MPVKFSRILAMLLPLAALGGCNMVVMSPSGDVATQQANLILYSTGLMLLIVLPVIVATLLFAWRYRASNRAATYDPDWHHSTRLEVLIWTAPLMIIIALGAMTWLYTHLLDPYRPLDRIDASRPVTADTPTLTVQVVALDWKWMFIYPELNIATVNQLVAPVDTPINFRLTASTVMNAFYVPTLAGMIYAMPGMETQLHAVSNRVGEAEGIASHYSGPGFSNMHFRFDTLSQGDFEAWVERVRAEGQPLDRARYLEVEQPSELEPVQVYSAVEPDLFRQIVNLCVEPGRLCADQMMHIDRQGGGGLEGTPREQLVYDGNRSHGTAFGHGPSGYAGAQGNEGGEGSGPESPGATFPAIERPTRGGSMPSESAAGDGPHVEENPGQPAPSAPSPSQGEGGIAPNQLND